MKVYWRVEQNVNGIKTVDTYERQHSDEVSADVYELYLNTKPNVVSACRISENEFKKIIESVRKNAKLGDWRFKSPRFKTTCDEINQSRIY